MDDTVHCLWAACSEDWPRQQVLLSPIAVEHTGSKAATSTYWKEMEVLRVSPNFGHSLHLMVIIYGVVRVSMAAAPCALHPFPFW